MIKTYQEAKTYLEQFIPTPEKAHGTMQLDRIRYLCNLLGNPQTKYPIIHVGGTSGKGSTATFAATILKETGLTVGLHVSPHLELFTERVQINNKSIEIEDFVTVLNELIPYFDKTDSQPGLGELSYFERLVALAFYAFYKRRVDAAVIEVGLGGKLDATNIIPPSVAIVTNISLDHTNILGKTVYSILTDKMGIIKPGSQAIVSGISQPKLQQMLIKKTQSEKIPLFLLGRDFQLSTQKPTLPGSFQHDNFSLATKACDAFIDSYFSQKKSSFSQALKAAAHSTFIPGRLEIISKKPLIILDGAHNKAKMKALVSALKKLYLKQKFITIIAVKQGKPTKAMLQLLEPITYMFICTTFAQPTDTGLLTSNDASYLARFTHKQTHIIKNSTEALSYALTISQQRNIPIIVTGSLYLVGEIRTHIKSHLA